MPTDVHITVADAIDRIRRGHMVVVVDDEDRENEGDLTMAADLVTPEAVNFMAQHGRGLVCLALSEEKVAQLRLPMMTADNRSMRGTAFTVSVDARSGVTTGISARERAHTILAAVAPHAVPDDLVTPGHVFPLRGKRGGVLVRSGHTEAAIDLARLAGRSAAGVICEIMREDGEMARMPDLEAFAARHGLGIVRVGDLIRHRLQSERLVQRVAEAPVRLGGGLKGEYRACVYVAEGEDTQYLALVLGDPAQGGAPPLVRVQSAGLLRDVFGIAAGAPGDGPAPAQWLRKIEEAGRGVLLYVVSRSGIDLATLGAAPRADAVLATGGAGHEAPLRNFGLGAQVLVHLGLGDIRLLTNNPRRIAGLEGYGIRVVECVPSGPPAMIVALREEGGP